MKYKQLTLTKRYYISLIKEGYNQKNIAQEIGVAHLQFVEKLKDLKKLKHTLIILKHYTNKQVLK